MGSDTAAHTLWCGSRELCREREELGRNESAAILDSVGGGVRSQLSEPAEPDPEDPEGCSSRTTLQHRGCFSVLSAEQLLFADLQVGACGRLNVWATL